ncbi:type III pantothenate kinase [Thermotomaculum hydrothermale]|uniref:Type III pantothenate kinase n=1 Tax=Thermotomaculum hydrothermale TaxID=981385 RepID=A0A7R6PMD1_9BACT|nr:type III pantothenate kinase [Thermotomaculum hydrothermale]BBB31776.1 type III pantothenate kinase [Thermotomaculum hydrothermale]
MLLALDIGNTNTTIGVFKDSKLIMDFRLTTNINQTMDEYGILVRNLLSLQGIDYREVKNIIVSCVVPPLDEIIYFMSLNYFKIKPLFVKPGIKTGLALNVENPAEVGADRIVDCVAAINKYKPPLIVVDFGTATTFDAINEKNEFLGGAIAPGLKISAFSLFEKAAKLPEVEIRKPKQAIGRNTVTNIQSGLFFGYVGLVKEVLKRMLEELPGAKVVATGGLARVIAKECKLIGVIDDKLTLEGLRILFEKNKD